MTMTSRTRRRGLTLGEALVILAILGVVVALVVPAIQMIRDRAYKMRCGSNLRQIGIAAHNYHNDYKRLPPGYYGPMKANGGTNVAPSDAADRGPWSGCLLTLLPYLEQDAIFQDTVNTPATYSERANPTSAPHPLGLSLTVERQAWWTTPDNLRVAAAGFRTFRCPADWVDEPTAGGVLSATHVANGRFLRLAGADTLGRTNYVGVAGAAGNFDTPTPPWDRFAGIFTNRSALTLGDLSSQDGSSNTLMFGEGLGGGGGDRTHAWSWFGVGTMGTAHGLGRGNAPAPPEPPALGTATPPGQDGAEWYRFSSRHRGTVQFCFGDCSVRGLKFDNTTVVNLTAGGNNGSAWAVLQQLAGCNDGFYFGLPGGDCDGEPREGVGGLVD
jgi:type II secretory pathway pseudopilin PulG